MDEQALLGKLRRIEALYAGATTPGEREAARSAMQRIIDRLATLRRTEPEAEIQFSLPDQWSVRVFVALARRYDLRPYRRRGQRHTTLIVRAPRSFVDNTLWPEFREISETLRSYLDEVTERVIARVINDEPERAG